MDTREQLIAQSSDRHLIVTANAGSGKTRVLVNRYVNLVLDGIVPKEIIAITFTRKAAAEMLTKVTGEIENRIKIADTPTELKKLRKIREKLTNARISTIHSFCSSLLRDYPIESGISPNFTELSEADLFRIKENAIISVMEEWLEDVEGGKRQMALSVFAPLGHTTIKDLLDTIFLNSEIFDELEHYYKLKSPDNIIDDGFSYLSNLIFPSLLEGLERLNSCFGNIDFDRASKKNLEMVQNAINDTNQMITLINISIKPNQDNILKVISGCKKIKDAVYTKSNELRSDFGKLLNYEEDKQFASQIIEYFRYLDVLADASEYQSQDRTLIDYVKIIFEMAKDVMDSIEEQKQILYGIDFNDMITKTNELLNDEVVRTKIRRRLKYILIDEFQDTNFIQYEIVKKLIPSLSDLASVEDLNLFIVGDAKQSIYGFRNADVRVFEQAGKDIRSVNNERIRLGEISDIFNTPAGKLKAKNLSEQAGDIPLSATFRLQPSIAAFVNLVCGSVMVRKESEFDVEYEPLICARNVEGTPDDLGSISILLNEKKDSDVQEVNEVLEDEIEEDTGEAVMIAKLIKQIIDGENPYFVQEKEIIRKARYVDIAVLSRKRNAFSDLAAAFQNYKIPYILHSGIGFYGTQEIIDITSYLKFLHNQNDDISLAGVLKSNFFGLTDSDLFEVSLEKANTYWSKLSKYCSKIQIKPNENEFWSRYDIISRAYHALKEMVVIAPRLTVSQLILNILEGSGWYGTIVNSPAHEQMKANLEKFIQFSRDFENRGFKNLFDFVEEVKLLSESMSQEAEAVFLTGEDAVNVMTIHASKGLEFPILVLYQTNFATQSSKNELLSKELGLTFSIPVKASDEVAYEKVKTPLHQINKLREYFAVKAEEKRILYVALTRAKDHLIISGTLKISKDGKVKKPQMYLNMILDSIGFRYNSLNMYEQDIIDLVLEDNLYYLRDKEILKKSVKIPVKILRKIEDSENNEKTEFEKKMFPELMLKEIKSQASNEFYSATKLVIYKQNPEEYIQRYRLGLPAEEDIYFDSPVSDAETDDDALIGTLAGTLIHSALEQIKIWLLPNGDANKNALNDIVNSIVDNMERPVKESIKERIINECNAIASTNLLQEFTNNLAEAKSEYALYMPYYDDFLIGKIDLLIKNNEGIWEIWDWKTNRINSEQDILKLTEHYELQMQIYAYFIMLLFPEQQRITARLLFTRLAKKNAKDEVWTRKFEWNKEEISHFGDDIKKKLIEFKDLK